MRDAGDHAEGVWRASNENRVMCLWQFSAARSRGLLPVAMLACGALAMCAAPQPCLVAHRMHRPAPCWQPESGLHKGIKPSCGAPQACGVRRAQGMDRGVLFCTYSLLTGGSVPTTKLRAQLSALAPAGPMTAEQAEDRKAQAEFGASPLQPRQALCMCACTRVPWNAPHVAQQTQHSCLYSDYMSPVDIVKAVDASPWDDGRWQAGLGKAAA